MLYSCLNFFLILFNLMMLFPLQLLDWQGVTSFHSKPTPCHPCCSEWVSICCPGTAHPAHPDCSSHTMHGGLEVHKLLWLAVERHGELLYPKTARYWVSQCLEELFHLGAHMYLLCCSLPHAKSSAPAMWSSHAAVMLATQHSCYFKHICVPPTRSLQAEKARKITKICLSVYYGFPGNLSIL